MAKKIRDEQGRVYKLKKPFYKKVWFWVLIVFIIGIAATQGGDSDKTATEAESKTETKTETKSDTETKPVATDKKEKASKEKKESGTKYKAGTYIVGEKIPAGEYKVVADSPFGAYAEVASDSSGQLDSIIANEIVKTFSYITIADGQYFKLNGSHAIPVAEAAPYEPKNGKYTEGTYRVGVDIPAGEYEVVVTDEDGLGGYIEVATASTWQLDSILTNELIENNTFISVADGQYLKLTSAEITVN